MRSPLLVVGSLCGLVAGAATAQEVRPPDSGLTIKATVNEVLLDLVVRDKHGKLVKNLKPGDVEIYEDGVRQPIRGFRLVSGPEAAPPQEAPAAVVKAEPAATQKVSSASGPLRTLHLICLVFQNLDANTRKYAVEAVQEFLKEDLPPGTWVAIFNLDSNLTVLHNFTANRDELLRAAKNASSGTTLNFVGVAQAILSAQPNVVTVTMSGTPGPGGSVSVTQDLTGGDLNPYVINDASVSNDIGASLQRGELVQQRRVFGHIEGMRQTDQIIMMIDQLGKLPGRKTVLLMSPGLMTTGEPERFESILNKANHQDVTVYAIDVNGLTQNSNTQASTAATRRVAWLSRSQISNSSDVGSNMEQMRQDDYLHNAVRTSDTQATLRALSEGTGGFLIGNTNDLRKPFQHVLEDMDTHYEVVYDPVSDKYDGHFRKITYKLARADLTVESRAGYFAMPVLGASPSLAGFEVSGLMALDAKPRPHAFDFRSAALHFRPESTTSQYGVAFEMPAANLTATAEPEQKKHRLHASLLALVKDGSGQIVDKFSQDSSWEIPDDKLAAAQAQSITWTHPFNLPPGRYTVETAVLDREGNRASTNILEFNNPEHKGIGLSSVMLVQQVEPVKGQADAADPFEFATSRVIPELAPTLNPASLPYVYFVVYPDKAKAEKPQIEVQFLVDGVVVARQTSDLPPADASGAIPMVVGAVRKSGQCELKIAALQGGESAEQSVKYTVAER
ncbi:MAG: VWA domain-containing protein [Bryobacteraceae bacterium]|jgi:VWFA-related protein